jgi:hypothetical protein
MEGQPLTPEEVAEKVEHARTVERVLVGLGWLVLVLGILTVVGTVVELVLGDISIERALGVILGTALAGILSGVTAYGSGVNVGLSAERLSQAVGPAHEEGT